MPRPVRFQVRMSWLLALVGLSALASLGLREYLSPARAWRRAIGARDPGRRVEAWDEARRGRIEGLGRDETLAEVARSSGSADAEARAAAVVSIGFNEPDPRVSVPFLADRLTDADPSVRRLAARTIKVVVGLRGDGRALAVHELASARSGADPEIRRLAVEGLGDLADRLPMTGDLVPDLLRDSLAHDPDPGVRIASALALSRVGIVGDGAVRMLRDYVAGHSGYDCTRPHCSAAFLALASLLPRSDEAAACLVERALRADNGARDAGAVLTGEANQDGRSRGRVEALVASAARDRPEPEGRAWAATTLLKIGSTRRFLSLDDPSVRHRAGRAVALGGRVDLRIVAALEDELDDPDPTLHARAVETLREIIPGWYGRTTFR